MKQGAKEAMLMVLQCRKANQAYAASVATKELKAKKMKRIQQAMEKVQRKEAMVYELSCHFPKSLE